MSGDAALSALDLAVAALQNNLFSGSLTRTAVEPGFRNAIERRAL